MKTEVFLLRISGLSRVPIAFSFFSKRASTPGPDVFFNQATKLQAHL